MEIGYRIKTRRQQLGLTQDELAQKLGYGSRSSINKIELGKANLTQTKIKALADALDTTPAYIMGWEDEELVLEERQKIDKILDDNKDNVTLHAQLLKYAEFLLSQKEN